MPQESNTGADTTDKAYAAVQTNTFDDFLETGVDGARPQIQRPQQLANRCQAIIWTNTGLLWIRP